MPAAGFSLDVLDPEDAVLAHIEQHADAAVSGVWQKDLKLTKPVAIEDLVWHRVRYRFAFSDAKDAAIEGTESISQILRTPVLRIIGQQSYMAGAPAAVRVIVTDSKNDPVSGPGTLRISLDGAALFTGRLNSRGTTEAQFRLPAGLLGNHPIRYAVETPIGSTEFTPGAHRRQEFDPADH